MSKRQERERQERERQERERQEERRTKAKSGGASDILDEYDPVWAWIPPNWDDKCPACDSTDFLTGDDVEGEFDELCSNCGLTRESQESRVDSMLVELKRSFRENMGYNIGFVEKVLANLGTRIRTDGLDFVVEGMGLGMEDIDPEIIVFAEAKRRWREQGYSEQLVERTGFGTVATEQELAPKAEELAAKLARWKELGARWDPMFSFEPNRTPTAARFHCEACGNTIEVDQINGRELIKPLRCPPDTGCGGFPLSTELPTRFNLVLPMTSWELLSQTRAMGAGVDIDALRENLRLHLLERAQGEFENPRPHQYAYSNELLDELVRIRPRTKNALRSINGMGPWRMESSGDILRIIDEWLMRRCVHSIQSNMEVLAVTPEMEVSVTPEVLDDISQHFVEWARGRDKSPKRISTVEAKQKILELMGGFSDSNGKLRVSELRGGLADRGMAFSPSRLSQIITSMVNDDLIVRKKPVPYEKGVVILEFTEKGLAERLQASRGVASRVRNLVREICVERGGKAHLDEIYSRAESTNVPETTVDEVINRMLITGELSSTDDAKDVYQFPRQS